MIKGLSLHGRSLAGSIVSKQSCDLTLIKVEGEVFDCLNMLTPAPQSRCVPLWGREEGEMAGKGEEGRRGRFDEGRVEKGKTKEEVVVWVPW